MTDPFLETKIIHEELFNKGFGKKVCVMNKEKSYYKLINSKTGDVIYAEGSESIRADDLLELLGLKDYTAETITKEDYDREIEVDNEI